MMDTLSVRDREILKDVIHTFILTGEPVSSRAVAKLDRHGLSSATIRNVMADLEEDGYLSQPHTSAGRVPTGAGYHLYIDTLMGSRPVPEEQRRYIEEHLSAVSDPERLMSATTQLLSELSSQIGIVLAPHLGDTVLRAIDFVPLAEEKVLCVVVAGSGFVDNKVIDVGRPIARRELIRISNYLTENFAGMTLGAIRDRLLQLMAEERAEVDQLLRNAILLAGQALSDDPGPEILVEGTSSVLQRPELADIERVRRLLETFERKAHLVGILDRLLAGRGVRVVIGEESDLTSDLDFSLVATPYRAGSGAHGALGIFGPSRMEYRRVIPLVELLGDTLESALERAYGDRPGERERNDE